MSARSLADFLNADTGMARLSAQAERLLKLQRIYEQAMPPALMRHGRVANVKPGKIVIHAQNGAVAAKIRQLAPRIAEVFRQAGVDLNEIQVKVQPTPPDEVIAQKATRSGIGDKAKQGLTSLSGRLPSGSPLKEALDRFVKQARIRTTKR